MWVIQRVGWAVIALVLLAAVLGLFGPGPLSDGTASNGGLAVDHARFGRFRAPGTLHFRVPAEATAGGEVRLWLDRAYLQAIQVEGIVPEPDSVEGGEDRAVYVFKIEEPGRPMFIMVELTQEEIGARTPRMGIVDGPEIEFWQLTYP